MLAPGPGVGLSAMLALDVASLAAFHLEIMIASPWRNFDRRALLRASLLRCEDLVRGSHHVTHHFIMGDMNDTQPAPDEAVHGDLLLIGGPDSDPPVSRDETYVLPTPTARSYRAAYSAKWVEEHLHQVDYVMHLDDDSFLNLPLLIEILEKEEVRFAASQNVTPQGEQQNRHPGRRIDMLALGHLMETFLDYDQYNICDWPSCQPCSKCREDPEIRARCSNRPSGWSLGGCVWFYETCSKRGVQNESELKLCIRDLKEHMLRLTEYFGTQMTPLWMLGMGYVLGREIISFIARNANVLKKRGSMDVSLGYWLAGLEDVHWVNMAQGAMFHDHPQSESHFSVPCHRASAVVHRMTPERWKDFDGASCRLHC
eukprot:TRINITY_DN35091_c0_g1_i1.p1 TRINITY_DN35091_c0_g1~~TRINITY_DN35091_c0_g1_i1.p1  ORF type:complete len:371 (-),score=55.48 TRINITY_DN35091_c0_g1_i1:29-1141(-)